MNSEEEKIKKNEKKGFNSTQSTLLETGIFQWYLREQISQSDLVQRINQYEKENKKNKQGKWGKKRGFPDEEKEERERGKREILMLECYIVAV